MNYGDLEIAIEDRLNAYFAEKNIIHLYEAAVMPGTTAEAKKFENDPMKARVVVEFRDSKPSPSKSIGIVSQDESVIFRLSFEYRKIRGEGGLYGLMEQTKYALIGWRLPGCDALTYLKYGTEELEGVQLPYFEFECTATNVQAFSNYEEEEEILIGGHLQSVSFTNP